mmetsp:Transcript_8324/g.15697  ORF Transcript_8324/g.15697 Transcript_8324/m.15697 type:complete len:95 (-) Transcript_8324:189-473(-)
MKQKKLPNCWKFDDEDKDSKNNRDELRDLTICLLQQLSLLSPPTTSRARDLAQGRPCQSLRFAQFIPNQTLLPSAGTKEKRDKDMPFVSLYGYQ